MAQNQAEQFMVAMDQQTQQTAALVMAINTHPAAQALVGVGGPSAKVMPRISATDVNRFHILKVR